MLAFEPIAFRLASPSHNLIQTAGLAAVNGPSANNLMHNAAD